MAGPSGGETPRFLKSYKTTSGIDNLDRDVKKATTAEQGAGSVT